MPWDLWHITVPLGLSFPIRTAMIILTHRAFAKLLSASADLEATTILLSTLQTQTQPAANPGEKAQLSLHYTQEA